MVVDTCQCSSPSPSYPLRPHPPCPQAHPLCLCLYSCPTNRLISTIFLESMKKVKVKSLNCVWLFETPWTVAYQAPPSMGFSRQEYWSGLPFPSPGDLPDPGIEPRSPAFQADAGRPVNLWATQTHRLYIYELIYNIKKKRFRFWFWFWNQLFVTWDLFLDSHQANWSSVLSFFSGSPVIAQPELSRSVWVSAHQGHSATQETPCMVNSPLLSSDIIGKGGVKSSKDQSFHWSNR